MVFMLVPVLVVSTVLSVVIVCIIAHLVGAVFGLMVCIVSAVSIAPAPCCIGGSC